MILFKSLQLGLILLLILRLSKGENSEEKNVDSAAGQGDGSFSKKQGLAMDIPDQLAIETGVHEQIEQLPGYAKYPPVPVPVPMQGFSGSLVLPLPPQLGEGVATNSFGQAPPPPPPQQTKFHGPQIQGQFSQPHLIRQPPPPNYQPVPQVPPHQVGFQDAKITKSKEVSDFLIANPSQGPPQQHGQHNFQNHHQQHQQQHQQHHQQQQIPQQHQQPPHLIHSGEQQQRLQHEQHLKHQRHPNIFQQHLNAPYRGDQGPPKPPHYAPPPPHPPAMQESLTQSILKEFLSKAQGKPPMPPPHRFPGPPPPGFWNPAPNKQNALHHGGGGAPLHGGKPSFQGSKEVANELQAEGGEFPGPVVQYGGVLGPNPAGPWPAGPDAPDMAKIVTLDVKCEKNVMRIFIAFDRPFYGVIFSKGHYHNVHCIHLPAGLGHTSANFDIGIDSCGTQSNAETAVQQYGAPNSGSGSYFENIVVIQYDAQVQEVWDQARKLRCTWHDQYEKTVTFRPFPVDMLDVVRADFAGDNVGCWMQIQVGKGPWASEVSGLVKIGQEMTMVLAIKDDDNKFDMLVRNCFASDGQRSPIQLVDRFGCISRPKLMSKFTKIKNFGAAASVLSYAHFQAFKFPDSMEVHFQCTIQICRYECPEQCVQGGGEGAAVAGGAGGGYSSKSGLPADKDEAAEGAGAAGGTTNARRRRRAAQLNETDSASDLFGDDDIYEYTTTFRITPQSADEKENVGLNRIITVVSPDDLDLISPNSAASSEENVPIVEASMNDIVCMSTFGFASMIVILIGCLLIACVVSAVLILRKPRKY